MEAPSGFEPEMEVWQAVRKPRNAKQFRCLSQGINEVQSY
jgi:hypothetical protein